MELVFAAHLHELGACQNNFRPSKRFDREHRSDDAIDGAMVFIHSSVVWRPANNFI